MKLDTSKVYPLIFRIALKSNGFNEHIQGIAYGTSTQPNIQIDNLLSYSINFPPFEVQETIVKFFEELENLNYLFKTQNQKLTQLQSLLLSRLATLEG